MSRVVLLILVVESGERVNHPWRGCVIYIQSMCEVSRRFLSNFTLSCPRSPLSPDCACVLACAYM